MRSIDSIRLARRSFLKKLGAGLAGSAALSGLPGCDTGPESEQPGRAEGLSGGAAALAAALREEFDYLRFDDEVAFAFARDFEAAYGPWRANPEARPWGRFLASTDFFQNGGDEARPLHYVRFYDPYRSPCYNPFAES